MARINQEEYEVLKGLDNRAKSIVRQDRGWLWVAEQPIMKDGRSWFVADGFDEKLKDDNLFQFIQWEDEEPYNIAELIEEYESSLIKSTPWTPNPLDFESEEIEVNDKKWLIKRVENYIPINDKTVGHVVDNILDIINQLDEPEVLSQEWIKDNQLMKISPEGVVYYVPAENLQNLLVPKQEITEEQVMEWLDNNEFYCHATAETVLENAVDKGELGYYGTKYSVAKKPVIPQFVADWWGRDADSVTMYGGESIDKKRKIHLISNFNDRGLGDHLSKVEDWIDENESSFLDLVNGKVYEVEKEPLYYVQLLEGESYLCEEPFGELWINNAGLLLESSHKGKMRFTEKEIKDYDERFWAFAVEVVG